MGRPKKIQPDDSENRYRSAPEDLKKLKAERLTRMKRFIKRDFKEPGEVPESSENSRVGGDSENIGISEAEAKEVRAAFDRALPLEAREQDFSIREETEAASVSNFCHAEKLVNAELSVNLTPEQIKALEMACRTDDMIDDMLNALEEAGANQRWLTAAKVSLHCGMMEISRAILRPKGF